MRDFLRVYWPFMAIAFIGLIIALRFVEPAPPRSIAFAAGTPGGAYYAFAQRYQRLLEEKGVRVDLIETAGSVENLKLVAEGDADIGLVQGGIASPETDGDLRSLGGLFLEPFWVFVREGVEAETFGDLKSARLAIGQPGSGTRALSIEIKSEWGADWEGQSSLPLSAAEAKAALLSGEIDAAVYVASVESPIVQDLLTADGIRVVPFAKAGALSRRAPALAPITLLKGVLDIGGDIPTEDTPLIAPVAQIVAHRDTHPAIQAVLLEAADAIHSDGTLLSAAGRFPDPLLTDLPMSSEAKRFFDRGPSVLRRWFSFGMANFLERAWVLAIPLLTLLIPLARAAPPIYRWQVRRRIYVWYSDLRELETEGRQASSADARAIVIDKLARLQEDVGRVDVPLSYTDDLYRLRNHIEFVENLLTKLNEPASAVS
ncbi:MAG: TAXI family TRAP transporter solute-binding subunit [Pseudomonadota bacterium]